MPTSMVQVRVMGLEDVQAEFRDIYANQLPFANASALTQTAKDAQAFIQNTILPSHFTLRKAAWMQRNIKVKIATKKELQASVEDTFYAMYDQETGDDKVPMGKAIAVPLSGARSSDMALVASKDRPKSVMQNGGFIRNGIMYAVPRRQRLGRVSWRRGRQGPQPMASQGPLAPVAMYALVPKARMKPRYGFEVAVADVVNKNFEKNFEVAFAKAVRTAKK